MPVYTSDGFSYKDMLHFQLGQPEDNATPADKSSASPADKGNLSSKDEKLNLGLEPIYGPNAKHFGPEAQAKAEAILGHISSMAMPTEFFTLFGRAYQGEDITLNEVLGAALQMATAGFGAGQFMMPKGSIGMYGSRIVNPAAEKVATELEKLKLDPLSIKKVTGLERGPHGGWLREFSTADVKVNPFIHNMEPGKDVFLSKIMDAPELYRLYPEARDIVVTVDPKPFEGKYEKHSMMYVSSPEKEGVGIIAINPNFKNKRVGPGEYSIRQKLIHEVQHWIQHKEGRLGYYMHELPYDQQLRLRQEYLQKHPALMKEMERLDKKLIAEDSKTIEQGTWQSVDTSISAVEERDAFLAKIDKDINYKVLPMEVEAVRSMERWNLTPKQIGQSAYAHTAADAENAFLREQYKLNPDTKYPWTKPGEHPAPTVKNVPIESGFAGNNPKLQGISGSTVPTIINPTRRDLEAFIKNKKIRMLRGVKDANGHSYFWDGDKATHWDIEQGLMLPGVHSEMHINPNNLDDIFPKEGKGVKSPSPPEKPETIVTPAIRTPSGDIVEGSWHGDAYAKAEDMGLTQNMEGESGFITSTGRFVDRQEALKIAKKQDQILRGTHAKDFLMSHNIVHPDDMTNLTATRRWRMHEDFQKRLAERRAKKKQKKAPIWKELFKK